MSNVKPIEALSEFLKAQGWEFLLVDDSSLRGTVGGEHGGWAWSAVCIDACDILMFHANLPMRVPKNRRAAVAEFLSRANWGMIFGNFEMNWSDGQVVFRTSIPVASRPPSEDSLAHLVFANCMMADCYLLGLAEVAFGRRPPKMAVAHIEAEPKKVRKPAQRKPKPLDVPRPQRFFLSDN